MIFSEFRAKFQKRVTCVAFSIKFAKTNQKFAENSEFNLWKNSLFNSELFTSLLGPAGPGRPLGARVEADDEVVDHRDLGKERSE